MGKTPLLPLYAAALGASDGLLGFIVSVSTLTGMVLKPFIGILSDRWGRRGWLIAGTAFFAFMPFAYRFVDSPDELVWVRLAHGMATAIYGPVSLAYVAEQSSARRAERLAWFGSARGMGYIVGPAAAGWMLLTMDPVGVFTVIGILSAAAFAPIALLPETAGVRRAARAPLLRDALKALVSGGRNGAVWLAGGMEASAFVALYAAKTFLPIYALQEGFSVAAVGVFFSVQEAAHLLFNPIGGRFGDRFGYAIAVPAGMLLLAASIPLLPLAGGAAQLMAVGVVIGCAQALVFPSTIALVSQSAPSSRIATGMGLVGTLKNGGKVAGPVIAGVAIARFGYEAAFAAFGAALAAAAALVWLKTRSAAAADTNMKAKQSSRQTEASRG